MISLRICAMMSRTYETSKKDSQSCSKQRTTPAQYAGAAAILRKSLIFKGLVEAVTALVIQRASSHLACDWRPDSPLENVHFSKLPSGRIWSTDECERESVKVDQKEI